MFTRTERLLLRPGWIEDARDLHAAMNDQAIVRNLASAPWPYGLEDARAFLSVPRDSGEPNFLISLRTGGSARVIGGIGIADTTGTAELGYWIARPYWGLGFATEAARAVIDIARTMGLPRLTASHMVDNPASGRVLRKIGFTPTGRIVSRFSRGRDGNVAMVEYAESDEGADVVKDMRPLIALHDGDDDPRRAIRLMAA